MSVATELSSSCPSSSGPGGTRPPGRKEATFCLVLAGLLWGTGGLIGALLGRDAGLSALAVAAYRLLAGGGLMVGCLMLTGRRWPAGRGAWARIAVNGLLSALFQGCYFVSISLTSVSLATLITIGSAPVLVLAAERVRGSRRIGRPAGCATGLALTGLALLAGLPSGGFPESAVLASAGLAVLAATGFATLTLVSAQPVAGLDDLAATGFGFALGGLALLPVAAAFGGIGFTPAPVSLGLLAALGTGPTAVAYTLYFRGLRTAPAGIAALLSLLEPLTGTVLAALILGDRLGPTGIAGAVVLAMALILAAVAGQGAASPGRAAGAAPRGSAARRIAASGHGPADHGGGPVQHGRAERDKHGERLPHGRAGNGAGRQDPGGGDRVVERVQVGQDPHPGRPE